MERDRQDHRDKLHCEEACACDKVSVQDKGLQAGRQKTNNNHYGKYSGVVTATTKKSDKITQADIDVMKRNCRNIQTARLNLFEKIIPNLTAMVQSIILLMNF